MSASSLPSTTNGKPPVVIITHEIKNNGRKKKRAKTNNNNGISSTKQSPHVFHPDSDTLLDDMLHPLNKQDFLHQHFRKDAVHIQRRPHSSQTATEMVSNITQNYLFDGDVRTIFAETSSENVFLWLRPPPPSPDTTTTNNTLNSVEIADSETAYALHKSGCHPAYCRAPPILEQHLVGSLLKATGLGGGHYHPPHLDTVTLGGGTTLGRGEVELFLGAPTPHSFVADKKKSVPKESKNHTTGWHTDFQENFTIQLSGIKKWTLRRGTVRHPIRATTPHYSRDATVIENQLKLARLSCLSGNAVMDSSSETADSTRGKSYGFEYGDNNAYGPEQTITLYPGDVFYFPSGMWHKVETIKEGISLNVSLMGTTYANLVGQALQHLMVQREEGWREIVTSRPGDVSGESRLKELLSGLSGIVDDFVTKQGGAQSLLPPALCYPPLEHIGEEEEDDDVMEEEEEDADDDDDDDDEDQSSANGKNGKAVDVSSDNEEEEEAPLSSGIIIPMNDFQGPPGWACSKPTTNAKLVKNPLATLMSMSDITNHCSDVGNQKCDDDDVKQYVLNVNYAGNEMMESHIRVILETSDLSVIQQMNEFLDCEARGDDPGQLMSSNDDDKKIPVPSCLLYYGYFSWVTIE
mmetsp:Transcript_8491/g.12438  ORF Transcript_8491/g.12438 Transcript_8491/m.12438 type:complete len:635 (-) Transcript_8491:209-2113(-)